MSPAVLTETVWALAHENPPLLPARVIVVTTAQGRQEIERQLFSPLPRFGGQTAWEALRAALVAKGHDLSGRLRFGTTADDVRVITVADGPSQRTRELSDLRIPADNEAAADFLLEQLRSLVENPDTQLVASLAGGRKTMGALLYACFTLVGRDDDRLTHVLVNEPFDQLREFFFPAQPGGSIQDRAGARHRPQAARIELADVPFVALRHLFRREFGRSAGSFLRLVESCRAEVRERVGESIRLTLERSRPEGNVNGRRLTLPPREHLLLLFLAGRARAGQPAFPSQKDAVDPLNLVRRELCASSPGNDCPDWRRNESLQRELDDMDIRRALANLRAKLQNLGGAATALAACLPSGRGYFALQLPPTSIELKP
jgi:CRISPR-associated protein (TIGR02584 family)